MRISISGGIKTINISNAIQSKIESGGDDIVTLSSIDELIEYIDCGYNIDRIILIEQAITEDGSINDMGEIRGIINNISSIISAKQPKAKVVFLTKYDDLADIIYEESLSVRGNSIIVIKQPPYAANFFIMLATEELDNIDSELTYTPGTLNNNDEEEWEQPDDAEAEQVDNLDLELLRELAKEDTAGSEEESNMQWDDDAFDDDSGDKEIKDEIQEDTLENDSTAEVSDEWEDENTDTDDVSSTEEAEHLNNDVSVGMEWEDTVEDSSDIDEQWEDDEVSTEETEQVSSINEDEIYSSNNNVQLEGTHDRLEDIASDTLYTAEDDTSRQLDNEAIYKKEESSTDDALYTQNDREAKGMFSTSRLNRKQRAQSYDGIKLNIDGGITTTELAHRIESFASRGNSIVVTGSGGTGVSTIVLNMANFIASLGYSVLIVDMDTMHRTQSYITKQSYNSIEAGDSSLMTTINSGSPAERYAKVVRPGIHLLSMWMGGDCVPVGDIIKREKLPRFINSIKSSYNFAIYDIPFEYATTVLQDVIYTADNIVNVVDCSNYGISKFMLDYCNIASEEMQEALFNRTEIVFNKFRGLDTVMGRKVRKFTDILKILDDKVIDLTSTDSGIYFSNMHIVSKLDYDDRFEEQWFGNKWYSDTPEGRAIFGQLVGDIILY